jgi:hypothetical protein
MNQQIRYRGKTYATREVNEIRKVIHSSSSRHKLMVHFKRDLSKMGWTQANGVLSDMICRGLLLRLNAEGLIELPPPIRKPLYLLSEHRKPGFFEVDQVR